MINFILVIFTSGYYIFLLNTEKYRNKREYNIAWFALILLLIEGITTEPFNYGLGTLAFICGVIATKIKYNRLKSWRKVFSLNEH